MLWGYVLCCNGPEFGLGLVLAYQVFFEVYSVTTWPYSHLPITKLTCLQCRNCTWITSSLFFISFTDNSKRKACWSEWTCKSLQIMISCVISNLINMTIFQPFSKGIAVISIHYTVASWWDFEIFWHLIFRLNIYLLQPLSNSLGLQCCSTFLI